MNTLSVRATNADGTCNVRGEMLIQKMLAALLMAILTCIVFRTANLLCIYRGQPGCCAQHQTRNSSMECCHARSVVSHVAHFTGNHCRLDDTSRGNPAPRYSGDFPCDNPRLDVFRTSHRSDPDSLCSVLSVRLSPQSPGYFRCHRRAMVRSLRHLLVVYVSRNPPGVLPCLAFTVRRNFDRARRNSA